MANDYLLSLKKSLPLWLWILIITVPAGAQNVGINTTTPLAALHVDLGASLSNGILFSGLDPSGGSFPSLGAGYRLMYYPGRGVFRAGYVEGTQWDNSQVGAFSFAFGYNPTAKGNGSTAFGDAVYAGGTISTAFGNSTSTKGYSSFVMGMYNDPLLTGPDQDVETPQTPLLMVGNGDGNGTRNNALTVFKNGDVLLRNYSPVLVDPGVKLPPVTGPGTRMMWLAEKSAFRLGTVHNNDWDADSIGTWSTGIGYSTKAKGQFSLALGLQTIASGITSTALGYNTSAYGENSIAMGSVTTALGANSTSMGFKTNAGSYGSVSIGRYNDTIVNANRTAWIGTDPMLILGNGTSDASLHNTLVVYKNGNIISKNPTPINSDPGSIPLPATDPGTRMMWLPEKSAFRAGTVDNTNWNADSLGTWSTGFGFSTKAKGPASFAAGFATSATGLTSTAFGYGTTASGENAIAMGSVSIASGPVATAMGYVTLASGFSSIAMGANTRAIGVNSTSMGSLTTATGLNTTSMGYRTYAKSYGSVALGRYNDRITTSDSTAWIATDPLLIIGNGTSEAELHNAMVVYKNGNMILKNPNPFYYTELPEDYIIPVSGEGTRMMWLPELSAFRVGSVSDTSWDSANIGLGSFGAGFNSIASGDASTAFGFHTTASGSFSMAAGLGIQARGYSSLAIGYYNDPIVTSDQSDMEPTTPLFLIGNGDGDAPGQRKNAMVVRKDGHVGIGTNTPVTNLDIRGNVSSPSIPGFSSSGIVRIGVSANEGIDIGKMGSPSYAGWIQSGVDGVIQDPLSLQPSGGQVGIGTTDPENSALLELNSTTRGFLPPRMTHIQRTALVSPADGLVIWCSDCGCYGQLQVFNGSFWANMSGSPAVGVGEKGVRDGGGIIFYTLLPGDPGYDPNVTHGLVATIFDKEISDVHWGCYGFNIPGAAGTAFGTGNQNTFDIVDAACGGSNAGEMCFHLVEGGYDDWYLPSKVEMEVMRANFQYLGGWSAEKYFTSSEIDDEYVWMVDFVTGNAVMEFKYFVDGKVRAIRSF